MITLQELFDTLAYGELSNIAVGNSPLNTINEGDYPKIVSHINLGLVELYKRFHLRQGEVKVHQYPGISTYYLRSSHSGEADSMDEDIYLEVGEYTPFMDDVLKVVQVFDAYGGEIPLNDTTKSNSVFTPSFDVLTMVPCDPVEVYSVVYRARYPKIVLSPLFNPATVELHIPDFIVEPLLFYVASRVFKGMITVDGEVNPNTSNTYQFELSCKKIEMFSLPSDVNDTRDRFTANGWV